MTHIVKRADVRMVQLGNSFSLELEASLPFGAFGEVLGKNFDGYRAVEAGVGGFVDFAHSAGTDRRKRFDKDRAWYQPRVSRSVVPLRESHPSGPLCPLQMESLYYEPAPYFRIL